MKYTIFGENQIKLERYHLGLYYHKDHFPSGASNILLIRLAPCVSPLESGGSILLSFPWTHPDQSTPKWFLICVCEF